MPPKKQSLEQKMEWPPPGEKRERQILVFRVAMQELGVDLCCVREVLRSKEIYPFPKAPDFIEGVIHLRGHLIALIDLRKRLHPNRTEEDHDKKVMICQVNGLIVGVIVENLREILSLPLEEIRPMPRVISMQMEAEIISGIATVGERVIPILNLEQIITKKMVRQLLPGEG